MTNASVSPSVAPKTSVDEIPWNKHMSQQRSISDWIVDIIIWVLIVAIVAVVIYPIWFIVVASFSDQTQVSAGNVTVWPKGFTVAGYIRVFQDSRIWTGYTNTILYTVFGTALNLIVTLPAAFGLSRVEFKPRRVILFLFTFTMYFAGGLVPNYLLFKALGLLDNPLVFILPGAVSVWNLIIARSFFETSIPEDLHDAAQIEELGFGGGVDTLHEDRAAAQFRHHRGNRPVLLRGALERLLHRPHLHSRKRTAATAERAA